MAGLKTWKRQLHGNANYDLARRLLLATYKLRQAITFVRAPFISIGETQKALADAGLSALPVSEQEKRSREAVYVARWQPVVQAGIEFDAEMLEAETLWGSESQEAASGLRECMRDLLFAVEDWVGGVPDMDTAAFKKMREVVFGGSDQSNDFTRRLSLSVAHMETMIRPHLK